MIADRHPAPPAQGRGRRPPPCRGKYGGVWRAIGAICAAAIALLGAHAAGAQTAFPSRVVKIVVPFPGGGINDVLARILADKLQGMGGQPVVIENKTGAGGNIGAELANQAEPDGHASAQSAGPAGDQSERLQAALL